MGQDGSCLAELLLFKRYRVAELVRRLSSPNIAHIEQIRHSVPGDFVGATGKSRSMREFVEEGSEPREFPTGRSV